MNVAELSLRANHLRFLLTHHTDRFDVRQRAILALLSAGLSQRQIGELRIDSVRVRPQKRPEVHLLLSAFRRLSIQLEEPADIAVLAWWFRRIDEAHRSAPLFPGRSPEQGICAKSVQRLLVQVVGEAS